MIARIPAYSEIVMFFKKKKPLQPAPEPLDLLAQAEEEALIANVLASKASASAAPIEKPPTQEIDEAEIEWEEQDEVYRPEPVVSEAFLPSLPLAFAPEIRAGSHLIFIRRQAWNLVQEHLRSDISVEQGGLLVGRALHDSRLNSYIVLIEEALIAPQGVETATSFSYTAETWEALFPRFRELPAHWTLLGSYHSHPNFGVFLSRVDLDTQENIFPHPWQTAIVVDPVRNEEGFFIGEKGVPCANWHILPDSAEGAGR